MIRHDDAARLGDEQDRRLRIRELNDLLRQGKTPGRVAFTRGFIDLDGTIRGRILLRLAELCDLEAGYDPEGEHDFGLIQLGEVRVIWKIDYYDRNMEFASDDPADPNVTSRVLTVMLATEY